MSLIDMFINSDSGVLYGITNEDKQKLVDKMIIAQNNITGATGIHGYSVMLEYLFRIPPSIKGDVVECGAYKGRSSAALSLACSLIDRKLWVCDSFEGLPYDGGEYHEGIHSKTYGYYSEGMFCGSLEEVKHNITTYGDISRCTFVKGFFKDSLVSLNSPIVFGFLDVDLLCSTKDCLTHIWPLLVTGGYLFTDDSLDVEVIKIFFDEAWWKTTLNSPSPKYVGSGCGIHPETESIGYTRKGYFDNELRVPAHLKATCNKK